MHAGWTLVVTSSPGKNFVTSLASFSQHPSKMTSDSNNLVSFHAFIWFGSIHLNLFKTNFQAVLDQNQLKERHEAKRIQDYKN